MKRMLWQKAGWVGLWEPLNFCSEVSKKGTDILWRLKLSIDLNKLHKVATTQIIIIRIKQGLDEKKIITTQNGKIGNMEKDKKNKREGKQLSTFGSVGIGWVKKQTEIRRALISFNIS